MAGTRVEADKLERLHTIARPGPVLILTHDNPDPDALASGKTLSRLLASWGIASRLLYSGLVSRAENKAMLALLTPEWENVDIITNVDSYSAIAVVDTQPGAGNNSLPVTVMPEIVFDHHHPLRDATSEVKFLEVRPEIGATVSLVYQYLEAAGITPDPVLATAIFYGIEADTRGLSRGDSPSDQMIYFKLLSLIDRDLLNQVEQAGLPRDYFRAFCGGLQAAEIFGQVVVANLGVLHRPDFGAEMADLLIRLEETRAVLCMGSHAGTLHLSLRTVPLLQDAGLLIQRLVVTPGKAGGHGTMAGGQVPLENQDQNRVILEVKRRFLAEMGETGLGFPLMG